MFKGLFSLLRRQWPAAVIMGGLAVAAVLLMQSKGPPRRYAAESRVLRREGGEILSAGALRVRLPADLRDVELRLEAEDGGGDRYRVRALAAQPARAVEAANAAARTAQSEAAAAAKARADRDREEQRLRVEDLRDKAQLLEGELRTGEVAARERERRMAALQATAAGIERQVEEARSRQDEARARIRELEAAEHRLREAPPSGDEEDRLASPVLDKLRAEMDSIRGKVAVQRLARTPESAEYKQLAERLGELQEEYRAELFRVRARTIVKVNESIRLAEDELRALDERRLRKDMEILKVGDEIREDEPRRREAAATRQQLAAGEERLRRLSAREPEAGPPIVILQEAAGAKPEGGGASGLLPWGLLGAVALGLLAAAAADRLDARVRTDADVRRHLNLPSLALVEEDGEGDALIHRRDPADPMAETFSGAATVLRSYLKEREFKTCAVTSGAPGEGKSTVAANLAVALARKGVNVALVDADLRAPRVHEIFAVDNAQGLSTYLQGGDDPNSFVSATEIAQLFALTSGPVAGVNPEAMESSRMADLVKTLREKYEVVLFDAPPVRGAGAALTLARLVDTNVWVIRSGRSDRRAAGWTKHLLKNVRADVAGVILNRAPSREGLRYYTYPVTK